MKKITLLKSMPIGKRIVISSDSVSLCSSIEIDNLFLRDTKLRLVLLISLFWCTPLLKAQKDSSQIEITNNLKNETLTKKHFFLFGHQIQQDSIKQHVKLHHPDSTAHHSWFHKHKDSLAYHKHHFKHLKKYHSGLYELNIKEKDVREVFDDIVKETGIQFTYIGSIDIQATMYLESFSLDELIDEMTYRSGMIAIKEQDRYIIYGYGSSNIVGENRIIYKYAPRNVSAAVLNNDKLDNVDIQAEINLLEEQNILLLSGTLNEIKDAIFKIRTVDIAPKTVTIDLLIVEYIHGNNYNWGIDIVSAQQGRISNATYQPGGQGVGFTYNFLNQLNPSFKFNLQALVNNNFANVVSNPHVTTISGKKTRVNITEKRNFLTQTANTNSGVFSTQFQSFVAGVNLEITPTVLTNDAIRLNVYLKDSEFLPSFTNGDNLNVNTSTNELTSDVIAKNGETLILGGLISAVESTSDGGFPFLHKIPVIGLLFKRKRVEEEYVETVVYITTYISPQKSPYEVHSYETGRKIQEKLKKKSKRLEKRNLRKF